MSLYGYRESLVIASNDWGFYALIMAAMRKADSNNAQLLEWAWPEVWKELQARFNAPGGILPGEEQDKA